MQTNKLERIHALTFIILIILTLLSSFSIVTSITYTEVTEDNSVELSLSTEDFYLDTITNVSLNIAGKDDVLSEHIPLDIVLLADTSGSMMQSGWYLKEKPTESEEFEITIPKGDWSKEINFTVPKGVKNIAAEFTWDGEPTIPGSDGSEFVLNMYDGKDWYFRSASDADYLVNEHYSGKTTKPQILILDNPNITNSTEWKVMVNGRYFRPKNGAPDNLEGTIKIYYDFEEESNDTIEKSKTIFAYDAAHNALQSFISELDPTDQASLISFSSNIKANYDLTLDHDSILAAIDNEITQSKIGGGTDIAKGLYTTEDILSHKRDEAIPIVILLTDGQNDNGPNPVISASEHLKSLGYNVISIGLTNFVNTELLREVSYPSKSYSAATNDVLSDVYQLISKDITSIVAKEALLELYIDKRFTLDNEITIDDNPYPVTLEGDKIKIDLGPLSSVETKKIILTLTPTEIGNYSIGNNSMVNYTSIQNNKETLDLPIIPFNIYYAPCDKRNSERDNISCDWDKDFDNDLIINREDTCPDTPESEGVDADGCSCSQKQDQIDDNNECTDDICTDGIISHTNNNYVFPTYVTCPPNSCNGELFYQYEVGGYDTCTNGKIDEFKCTPTISYNTTCDIDDDNDSVDDIDDNCPDTPESEGVDADGCSCSQKQNQIDDNNECTDDICTEGEIYYVFNTNTVGKLNLCQESYCNGTTYYQYENGGYDHCSNGTISKYSCIPTIIIDADECAQNKIPPDKDEDGVLNEDDLCEDTPLNETTNVNGCSCSQLSDQINYRSCSSDKCKGRSYYNYPISGYDSCSNGIITRHNCEPKITSRSSNCKLGKGNGGGSSRGTNPSTDLLFHNLEVSTIESPFYSFPTISGSIKLNNKGDFNEKGITYHIYAMNNNSKTKLLFSYNISEILSPNDTLTIPYIITLENNISLDGIQQEVFNSKVQKIWIDNLSINDNINTNEDIKDEIPIKEELEESGKRSSSSGTLYEKPIIPIIEVQNEQKTDLNPKSSLSDYIESRKDEFKLYNSVHIPIIIAGTGVVVILFGTNNLLALLRKRFFK